MPVLLRRLLIAAGRPEIGVSKPFRVPRNRLVRQGELERAIVQGVRDRQQVSGLLVVLDADDDAPDQLERELAARCRTVSRLPSRVVAATREVEAWILGSKESLRGVRGIRHDATAPPDAEAIRGAKERLNTNFAEGSYLSIDDQAALVAQMDLTLAAERCPSFRRFVSAVEGLLVEMG